MAMFNDDLATDRGKKGLLKGFHLKLFPQTLGMMVCSVDGSLWLGLLCSPGIMDLETTLQTKHESLRPRTGVTRDHSLDSFRFRALVI